MKYIFLTLALAAPVLEAKNVFVLNDYQVVNMIDSSCDAALEGSLIGLELAYEMYTHEDHADKTLLEKIKAFRWQYAALGGALCAALAIEGEYLTSVLINSIAKPTPNENGN